MKEVDHGLTERPDAKLRVLVISRVPSSHSETQDPYSHIYVGAPGCQW